MSVAPSYGHFLKSENGFPLALNIRQLKESIVPLNKFINFTRNKLIINSFSSGITSCYGFKIKTNETLPEI
jgi:hypothetical protein